MSQTEKIQVANRKTDTTKTEGLNAIASLAYRIQYFELAQTEVLEDSPLNAQDVPSFDHPSLSIEEDGGNRKKIYGINPSIL